MSRDFKKTLEQYARYLITLAPQESQEALPLLAQGWSERPFDFPLHYVHILNQPIQLGLWYFKESTIITGPPQSGKSYSLRVFAANHGLELLEATQTNWFGLDKPPIPLVPIVMDMRHYDGDLMAFFPEELREFQSELFDLGVHFIVDSFSEAPDAFSGSGRLLADITHGCEQTPNCRWTIASRSLGPLTAISKNHLWMGNIESDYVRARLGYLGIDLGQRHTKDLIELLSIRVLFEANVSKQFTFDPGGTHPAHLLEQFAKRVENACVESLPELAGLQIEQVLGELAFRLVERDQSPRPPVAQTFPCAEVQQAIQGQFDFEVSTEVVSRCLDRMMDHGLLVDHGNGELSFFHQQFRDYFAAWMAVKKLGDGDILRERIALVPWENVWVLATWWLDASQTKVLFENAAQNQVRLAINLARHLPFDRSTYVTEALLATRTVKDWHERFRLENALKRLPVDLIHLPTILELLKDECAGIIAPLVATVLGDESVPVLVKEACLRHNDFNLVQSAAATINPFVQRSDLVWIMKSVNEITVDEEFYMKTFFSRAFEGFDPEDLASAYFEIANPSTLLQACMSEAVSARMYQPDQKRSQLTFLSDQLIAGFEPAIPPFVSAVAEPSEDVHYRIMGDGLFNVFHDLSYEDREAFTTTILSGIDNPETASESAYLVEYLWPRFTMVRDKANAMLAQADSIARLVLLSADPQRNDPFWEELESTLCDPQQVLGKKEFGQITALTRLEWSEHRSLLRKILEVRNSDLTTAILGNFEPEIMEGHQLDWPWVEAMLDWFASAAEANHFSAIRFSEFVTGNATERCQERIIKLSQDTSYPHHQLLADRLINDKPE
ncbi:hypothetical protein [Bremerella sp.]|uniref:hypothetical protein n=1 Tax=Bremerella sp. TaxID=2795602 RepID=UPI00391D4F5B